MNARKIQQTADVAVIGGGPAGMQTALVLARARKRVVVFDAPSPPRNGASRGVHNFLGLDGLRVPEIRRRAWEQIEVYRHAEARIERIVDVVRQGDHFLITGARGSTLRVAKVVLAFGYHDVYPNVPGFLECWAHTIIPCPFCDGFENRDRVWGLVPQTRAQVLGLVHLSRNWTSRRELIVPRNLGVDPALRRAIEADGVGVHEGTITEVIHAAGRVHAVRLHTGERVAVQTLLWKPPARPSRLIEVLVGRLGLRLTDDGYVETSDTQETNVPGLFAAGDIQGWSGGIGAAAAGTRAASTIVHQWHATPALRAVG